MAMAENGLAPEPGECHDPMSSDLTRFGLAQLSWGARCMRWSDV